MVDAARQMLDELMGRNRNLHPSEAVRKVNWDDPDFCQYYIVKFCPHDLFINTRADLGPCTRIHDDEAKQLYSQARSSPRKRQYEDEFLRFCNTMLNDVERKIQKGKQRLQLMNRDQCVTQIHVSKYAEQLNNLNARIKKLLSEAEEAGIRGDVDQAQDLMSLCEQLKEEKDTLVAQHESGISKINQTTERSELPVEKIIAEPSTPSDCESDKKAAAWINDMGTLPEKQMEVCETCGAFLIVGDAQQRIEDHLMGKQHLGYSRLRKAVEEIQERRQKEREEEERLRKEDRDRDRSSRSAYVNRDRKRDYDREREYNREHGRHPERHRHHHKSHRRRSRSRNYRHSNGGSRSRSRSRY
ncbi:luc7-like protein 3 [Teleopsis dalmanni]|uniref:luc7-like protein 3 n=1 Tax=Teleopsis dalmanni TaxID=139649 RepID=UPI0018CD7A2C|nr:luc7-like protein 3 [Teleopsis dalmanni]XP_037939451.1 luc7-like protein 3 [Teleopsis dalmanni]